MATMQIISVLASLLLFASAAPEYRRSVPPEPVSEHPAFSTTEEPRHYPSTTRDYTTSHNGNSKRPYEIISCDASLNQALTVIADGTIYDFKAGIYGDSTDGYYRNNQRCSITFVTTEPRLFEILTFRIQLEDDSRCQYDSLCFGGTKTCGNWPVNGRDGYIHRYPVPAGQTFTVSFKTDLTVTDRGFAISVFNWPYNFTSPYYTPTAYCANSPNDFKYTYINPENYVDTCGQYNSYQPINSFFNTDNDFSYYSTEDYQYTTTNPQDAGAIIVRCDNGNTYHSYNIDGGSSITDSYNSYNSYSNNQAIIFKSSNYGRGFYNNNERCTLTLYTLDTPKSIHIYFHDFDIEYATGCPFDKVCIGGVNFCGNWTIQKYHYYTIPPHSSFTIYSLTDSSVTKRGFSIRITPNDTPFNYRDYEITGGDGSSPSLLNYDYVDGSNYVDKCSDSYDTSSYPSDQPSTPYYDTDSPVYDPYPEDDEVPF